MGDPRGLESSVPAGGRENRVVGDAAYRALLPVNIEIVRGVGGTAAVPRKKIARRIFPRR